MADVFANYIRGVQAGQAQKQHEEQLAENKLRAQILRHQIEGLKISDQVNARKLALEHYDILSNLPEALQPKEAVTQPNLQSRSFAGAQGLPDVVSSLMGERMGVPQEAMAAPHAQAQAPEMNSLARRAIPVNIPGVDAFGGGPGLPSLSISPQNLEQRIRQAMAMKAAEEMGKPYTLNEGDTRFLGSDEIARGQLKRPPQPTRSSLAYDAALGDKQAQTASETLRSQTATPAPQIRDVLLDGKDATLKFYRDGRVTDLDDNVIERAASRIRRVGGQATEGQRTYTAAQKAAAERWKQTQLAAVEKKWKETQPRSYDKTTGEPILRQDAQGVDIQPMTAAELDAEKARIQQSYLEQIGANQPAASTSEFPSLTGVAFDKPSKGATQNTTGAPPAPPGWKYVRKPGGGWTAVEDK